MVTVFADYKFNSLLYAQSSVALGLLVVYRGITYHDFPQPLTETFITGVTDSGKEEKYSGSLYKKNLRLFNSF